MTKFILALLMLLVPAVVQARTINQTTPFTERSILSSGNYTWRGDVPINDPISIHVNLSTQMVYVWKGDTLIGAANISSGRTGFDTPTGIFKVLGKEDNHHSKKYDADMPWTMWLNTDGVALHSGGTPGRPSSHGCVHLPPAFAKKLYPVVQKGTVVEVFHDNSLSNLNINPNSI